MEPRIQYAKTSDGVSIAYAVFGSGPAIVFPASIPGYLHMYKSGAGSDRVDELVSRGWSVIAYDGRGTGSSDRDTDDWTVEGKLRDLEAVVKRAAPDRFAVCGVYSGGPVAISYAVQHPDRVAYLVLSNTFAVGSEWFKLTPAFHVARQTLRDAEIEWEFAALTLAHAFTGYTDSELARRVAEAFRTGVTAKSYIAARKEIGTIDVRDLLPQISVPTLVIHDRTISFITQQLAPLIPNARFVETDDFAKVIDEFLREGGLVPSLPPPRGDASPEAGRAVTQAAPSGTAIILFADIADSTALTERLGDAAFRTKARELDGALRAAIRDNGGTPVEGPTLGDGVLASFTSAREAIEAALRCGEQGRHAGLPLHLGIHAGDVIRERDPDGRDNVYGGAVNIASRIAGLSAAGEVLVSETVRSLARTSAAGVRFEDRGEQELKGVGDKVRVWAVREGEV